MTSILTNSGAMIALQSLETTDSNLNNVQNQISTGLKIGSAKPSLEQQLETLQKQQDFYASMGTTTAQDGYSSLPSVRLLREAARRHLLKIDIEGFGINR